MDLGIPQDVTNDLSQILANLVVGDNDIRRSAEQAVNERLHQSPDVYILALAQFAVTADKEVMRSFSLVLLRRLLFRAIPSADASAPSLRGHTPPTLYDHLPLKTLGALERVLLHSLQHEPSPSVLRQSVTTVTALAGVLTTGSRSSSSHGHTPRQWHALQALAFSLAALGQGEWRRREAAYDVFAGCPSLVGDLKGETVVGMFKAGLEDPESFEVRLAATRASVAYLQAISSSEPSAQALMFPLLDTLPRLGPFPPAYTTPDGIVPPHASAQLIKTVNLTRLIQTLTPLTSSPTSSPAMFPRTNNNTSSGGGPPALLAPHLPALLSFLAPFLRPSPDDVDDECGPTPTVSRPFPVPGQENDTPIHEGTPQAQSFSFPPPISSEAATTPTPLTEAEVLQAKIRARAKAAHTSLRLQTLEFLLTLAETRPSIVRRVDGYIRVLVRGCLDGMGEGQWNVDFDAIGNGESNYDYDLESFIGGDVVDPWTEQEEWANMDPTEDANNTMSPAALYEQALDRLACAMSSSSGAHDVLGVAFQAIPSMIASFDWRVRCAGVLAIGALGEGGAKVMQNELGKVVALITPMFKDPHPRVRYAACQSIGQLCTDLEEVIQEQYHEQLFQVLIPALEDPEARVHAHAAAALINFCEGVERETLLPYLDPIVARLLRLLNPGTDEQGSSAVVRRYVQEQVITTLAMVADASEVTFAKHYPSIMPLLLNVLRNAQGPEYAKLRVNAMECAGLIAIAVGRDVFRPDANTLVELLMRIQTSPIDPDDTLLGHYLIATWAKICQAMGPEFEPYLPIVMPPLLATASAKPDVSVYDEDEIDNDEERDGWEKIQMDGQVVGIKTSAIEEKCQAFETLVIYCSTLGARFAPYLAQVLELTLPSLRFYFHDGVREACAMLLPMLLSCGKNSGTLTDPMVAASIHSLITAISTEHDASFLASLYKCLTDTILVIGGAGYITKDSKNGIVEATKHQLQNMADRRRTRTLQLQRSSAQGSDDLEEEKEDVALLEEMEEFALEDMAKMLACFDSNHPLLMAVSGVRQLGVSGNT